MPEAELTCQFPDCNRPVVPRSGVGRRLAYCDNPNHNGQTAERFARKKAAEALDKLAAEVPKDSRVHLAAVLTAAEALAAALESQTAALDFFTDLVSTLNAYADETAGQARLAAAAAAQEAHDRAVRAEAQRDASAFAASAAQEWARAEAEQKAAAQAEAARQSARADAAEREAADVTRQAREAFIALVATGEAIRKTIQAPLAAADSNRDRSDRPRLVQPGASE